MPTLDDKYDYAENEIPAADLKYVNRLRNFLNDTAELNILMGTEESTDLQLYHNIISAMEIVNSYNQPITSYSEFSNVPWGILKYGAVLEVLTSKGILSARNTLTYRDAGGVTVQDFDLYGRYINYFNTLYRMFYQQLETYKKSVNFSGGFGGVHSEYNELS